MDMADEREDLKRLLIEVEIERRKENMAEETKTTMDSLISKAKELGSIIDEKTKKITDLEKKLNAANIHDEFSKTFRFLPEYTDEWELSWGHYALSKKPDYCFLIKKTAKSQYLGSTVGQIVKASWRKPLRDAKVPIRMKFVQCLDEFMREFNQYLSLALKYEYTSEEHMCDEHFQNKED